jgi:hypothetical protein
MQNRLFLWQMDCKLSVLRNKEFPNFDKCTLSTNNFVCSCLIPLYLLHAPLFFLVTKVEMQLLILTLYNLFYFIEQLINIQFIETLNRTGFFLFYLMISSESGLWTFKLN